MWSLNKEKGVPIYVSIIELILSYIKNGDLLPGERLPSERKLANYFQVNRSTVVHALDELVALGWIIRKQGSGTIVNEGKWGISTTPRTDWRRYLEQNAFAKIDPFTEQIEWLIKHSDADVLDLYTGELPLDLIPSFSFPLLTWKHFLEEEQQDDLGYLPLRQSISRETEKEYGFSLASESLLITSGAQQALFLILQVLLHSGDSVAIEDPSFLYALPIFQAAGIRLYGVKTDQDGICLDSLEKVIRQHRVKMVMVNPSFQNPTGTTMSMDRRKALVKLCQNYQIPILEDDVFAKLNFVSSDQIQPLKKLDPENVLYIGSLSKILGSTTKIGWLSAPTSVNQQLAEARKMMDFSLSIFPQLLANLALTDKDFSDKVSHLRQNVEQRGKAVFDVLNKMDEWEVSMPKGGFYIWAKWKHGKLQQKDWAYFLQEGLLIAPSFFFGEKQDSIRINFTRVNEEKLLLFETKLLKVTKKITLDSSTL
ncbi:GntR family transcriptional regulator [Enterococcus haemoperoxidus ATCC BAA-382]|uniref:GntR family transcriptional regulator n=1 Tax=Enterococcus haemoperoxidus ATCC BAA-382 TaxID=1158608 RepID=R2QTF4_9ENTE|nr:PLP-dependent aminotransferase family protein [Enterococcus haemoperoxidus]EOH99822.1 GntR family transcriptional regulator [Enterococcus haemoperoxidus ATCC BAA-382]EOT62436.1 GntR family transcriptional regulator [Enterococcus haemoperoxidus ATCC BAA-382]OJG54292.1 GntR family transcriptional regulator [Enterococcus haemoperoxidus]